MKQMKRAAGLILAFVMISSMTLMGCQSKLKPADEVVGALYELAAKDDAAPMMNLLGFASEDDVRSSIMEDGYEVSLADQAKTELLAYLSAFSMNYTDEDVQEMVDNITVLYQKLTYTAEVTEQSEDKITVTLNVQGYTQAAHDQIVVDTWEAALDALTEEEMLAIQTNNDMEFINSFMMQFMKDCMAKASELEPTETTEIVVECEKLRLDVSGKEQVEWFPSDIEKFFTDVENSVFKE